ncbi:MAG: winged helix-turn-helix domain-containing protein [Gammaproteobacteria bacterium]|nr:winged helix-turn-helix domain-containing protein [Gammaproteobacteria bacterium]
MLQVGDRVISLFAMEQKLLATFIYAGSKPVSREKLIRALGADVSANALEVHIHGLRKQLGRDRITTIRGFGYRLSQT